MNGMCSECGLALVDRGELLETPDGRFAVRSCRNPACGMYGKAQPADNVDAGKREARKLGREQDAETAAARAEYIKRRMTQRRR